MVHFLNEDQKAQYHLQGFLKLGKVLDDAELSQLRRQIDEIMLGKAKLDYNRLLMQLDSSSGKYGELPEQTNGFKGATLNYRKIQNLEEDSLFRAYLLKTLFREICAYVYGPHASISCYRAMFMNKPAGQGTSLPWHQDGGEIWGLDRDPMVTIWTALDPATSANGCVKIIPGSHRLGLLSDYGHTISPEQEKEFCEPNKVVHLELNPGEAMMLHNWLLHSSDINQTTIPRRAFSVCYMDGRTRSVKSQESFPIIFEGSNSSKIKVPAK